MLGVVVAVAAMVVGEHGVVGWLPVLLYVIAAAMLASLPVRLPGGGVSLLPAILLPVWLSCGLLVATLVAVAALSVATVVLRPPLLAGALSMAAAVAGVIVGDLAAWGVASVGMRPEIIPETFLLGAVFALASWIGEQAIIRAASRGGLADEVRTLAGASMIANLLLVFPGTILSDVLAARGVGLFIVLLVVLVVALSLIALYLTAETERRGAAGERERLESIVSQVPDGIFAVRPDLTLDWVNETAARLTGWDAEAASGQPAAEVVQVRGADDRPVDHRTAFQEAASSGKAVHRAGKLQARDGETRSVVISYTTLGETLDGFEVGVAAVREIADDDSRDAQIADLGHELRSPLTAILGYTGLMLGAAPGSLDAERQAEFLARIAASGDYMLRLVNNLLDLRRMESGAEQLQPTPLPIDRILQLVVAMGRPRATEKGIDVALDAPESLPSILSDELLVRRIVDNLLSNAVKYTPSGGSVRVTARAVGDAVEIAVADTGIGLTEDEQQRLFQRFFRSSRPEARQERGTGLGLALVRESLRRLGGEIRVSSTVGVGTTFTVTIPPLARTASRATS
ncbi:MAG: PAS domain-containing protein [Chloroflexi bacterium]|nr:PAS domain-containing protein [Chloroflexota bacterium]